MTSAAEFLRTSRRFVGGDAHIAPRGIIEFALDFRKIGTSCRVDVVIDLGGHTITGKPGVSPVIIIESGADVTASASAAGGIAGSSRGTVSFCTMRGGYVSAGKASNGTSNAGGLVGSSGSSVDTDGAVESCVLDPPEGGLTVKGEGNYVGGLVGTTGAILLARDLL